MACIYIILCEVRDVFGLSEESSFAEEMKLHIVKMRSSSWGPLRCMFIIKRSVDGRVSLWIRVIQNISLLDCPSP